MGKIRYIAQELLFRRLSDKEILADDALRVVYFHLSSEPRTAYLVNSALCHLKRWEKDGYEGFDDYLRHYIARGGNLLPLLAAALMAAFTDDKEKCMRKRHVWHVFTQLKGKVDGGIYREMFRNMVNYYEKGTTGRIEVDEVSVPQASAITDCEQWDERVLADSLRYCVPCSVKESESVVETISRRFRDWVEREYPDPDNPPSPRRLEFAYVADDYVEDYDYDTDCVCRTPVVYYLSIEDFIRLHLTTPEMLISRMLDLKDKDGNEIMSCMRDWIEIWQAFVEFGLIDIYQGGQKYRRFTEKYGRKHSNARVPYNTENIRKAKHNPESPVYKEMKRMLIEEGYGCLKGGHS